MKISRVLFGITAGVASEFVSWLNRDDQSVKITRLMLKNLLGLALN